ncbi:MAG: hypothetical protein DRI74_04900 [Bacteroidetes bacterium]|nr:MAG: hypothetical protein DRI74_04900 [Bacteroidota bacterium]
MKKVTLVLIAVSTLGLFSCGGDSESKSATQEKNTKTEAVKTEVAEAATTKVNEEKNIYVKDVLLKNMDLKATENKFSQEDWDRISKTCDAYSEFKTTTENEIASHEELDKFFKSQGYKDYQTAKEDVQRFGDLFEVTVALPTNFGSLNGIKKLYGEEQFIKSCKESGEIYNELMLTAEDLKNIEKYSKVIGEAWALKGIINASEEIYPL